MDREAISNMLTKIVNGDNSAAQDDFENIISNKLNAALDAKKMDVARSIYGQQEVEDSNEDGEEQEEEPQEQESEDAVQ